MRTVRDLVASGTALVSLRRLFDIWKVVAIKILFIGDVHLSDTTPRSRKDDYTKAILGKLEQCAKISQGYDRVVFLGDIFHKKKPENNSHSLVGEFMDILRKFHGGDYRCALVGNHDIRDGNMGCLPEQPLGVIFKTGLLRELKEDEIWYDDVKVQISPLPFSYESETNPAFYDCVRNPEAEYVIKLTHASILPQGLPHLAYKMPHVSADMVWGQKWDLLVNGHIHHHSEVLQSGNQRFVNIGAIARGALNSFSLEQNPRVLGLELSKDGGGGLREPKFTWYDLNVAPANEIFRVEDAVRVKGQKKELDLFVQGIQDSEGRIVMAAQAMDFGVALEDYLTGMKVEPVVSRKVKEYVGIK
jgi:UDP-2,3-diacylglucosamine pyrophosphatase LpxH